MHTFTGECIEVRRKRSHKCLTLTGAHLGNLSSMENNTANELYIVVPLLLLLLWKL